MFFRLFALLSAISIAFPVMAEVGASKASIQELMAVTKTQKMLDATWTQMDGWMQVSLKEAMAGETLNAEQEKIAEDMRSQVIALLKEDMSWSSLESDFIDIYQKSFTQKEVDDMLAFYKSEAGQAVIAKMPLVMQNSMQVMRGRMSVLMPKVRKIVQDSVSKMKSAAQAGSTIKERQGLE